MLIMERVRTTERGNKHIIVIDLSDIKSNTELRAVVNEAKNSIQGYDRKSVYTVTDISRIAFDTQTKEIAAEWMAFNQPYVIQSVFIGATAIRKIMMNMVFTLSGRDNIKLMGDMEQALAWIDTLDLSGN